MKCDTLIYLDLLLTKQFYHQEELSWLVTLMTFLLYTVGWQEIHTNPWLLFSMHISLFIISCLFAFPKTESEASRSFQPYFPDSNLITNFVFKMHHKKKGHECIKIIKVKLRCSLWAKAQMEKRDTSLIWHSQCWKHGSGAVGRRLSTVSWQEEQRKYCVTALIRKCSKFHSWLYWLPSTLLVCCSYKLYNIFKTQFQKYSCRRKKDTFMCSIGIDAKLWFNSNASTFLRNGALFISISGCCINLS